MELKQLEYIVAIANEQNITRAAEKLFITQSALTQQLLKLERELKTPLFYRSRNNWQLTPAGEVYVKNAREIMKIKRDTYRAIGDITHIHEENLAIGFSSGRGVSMFAQVYPSFHAMYPDVIVNPSENLVVNQIKQIKEGKMDMAFVTLPEEHGFTDLHYTPLSVEDIYLVIPRDHPYVGDISELIDLRSFCGDPFVLTNKESTMRPLVDGIFRSAGFSPKVLFETSHNPTIITMVEHGLCCGLIAGYYLRGEHPNIRAYRIKGMSRWGVSVCYRSDSYLGEPAKTFIHMAEEFFRTNTFKGDGL